MAMAMAKPSDHEKENVIKYFKDIHASITLLIAEFEKLFKKCEDNYLKVCGKKNKNIQKFLFKFFLSRIYVKFVIFF